jgi:hypothetical protein
MRLEIWLLGAFALGVAYVLVRSSKRTEMDSHEFWLRRLAQQREDYLND